MPQAVTAKGKGKLKVCSDLWKAVRWYVSHDGKQVTISNYEEARTYAKEKGYSGIKVSYV